MLLLPIFIRILVAVAEVAVADAGRNRVVAIFNRLRVADLLRLDRVVNGACKVRYYVLQFVQQIKKIEHMKTMI